MFFGIWTCGTAGHLPSLLCSRGGIMRMKPVHKHNQTDVLFQLRNFVSTSTKLMRKQQNLATPAARVRNSIGCQWNRQQKHLVAFQQQIHQRRSFSAQYSRFSASTIMHSYCKELNLAEDYDIIGFDLDGTLLRYELNEMTVLVYNELRQYLVQEKRYSRALLDLPLNFDFIQKGLVLDGPKGNLLKLSNEAVILRATHGTRRLTNEEIVAAYGPKRQWELATAFYKDPLSTWNGPASEEMRMLLDFFDMPSSLIFAQAVDLIDKETSQKPSEYTVWKDVLDALMHNYGRENFNNGKSGYFNAMRADPERYVLRTPDHVISWLHSLRATGKKLFLLTGSNIDFANLTATRAFGKDWQHLFDFVVTYAKKPGFFIMKRPFLRVDVEGLRELPDSEINLETPLQQGEIYSQGNWHQLHETFAKMLNKDISDARAVYFGDNIIQDVYTPVKHRDFDAVAISEELLLDNSVCNNYPFCKALGSQFWGSYFSVDSTPTLWSGFLSNYAQISVPSVEIIADTPPTKRIVCTNINGYYPALPEELKCTNLKSCWHGGIVTV